MTLEQSSPGLNLKLLTSLPSPGLSPQRGLVWAFYVGDRDGVQLLVYDNTVSNGAKDRGISLIFNPHHEGRRERFDFKLKRKEVIADGAGVKYSSEQIDRCKKIIDGVSAGKLRVFRASGGSEVELKVKKTKGKKQEAERGKDEAKEAHTPAIESAPSRRYSPYIRAVSLAFLLKDRLEAVTALSAEELTRALAEISKALNNGLHTSHSDVRVMAAILERLKRTTRLPPRPKAR